MEDYVYEDIAKVFSSKCKRGKSLGKAFKMQAPDRPELKKNVGEGVQVGPAVLKAYDTIPIELSSNYLEMKVPKGFCAYHVSFDPDVADESVRSVMLELDLQTLQIITGGLKDFFFSGDTLICSEGEFDFLKASDKENQFSLSFSKGENQKEAIRESLQEDITKALEKSKLTLCEDSFYNLQDTQILGNNEVELWTGFREPILQQCDGGLLICLEATYKIVHRVTVYDWLKSFTDKTKFEAAIKDQIVLTKYDNRQYKVIEIDWDQTPNSTFERAGKMVTYLDYYPFLYGDEYKITHMDQPLLVAENSDNERILLIPQFCHVVGDTTRLIYNPALCREIELLTKLPYPTLKFNSNFRDKNKTKLFAPEDRVRISGRVLPSPTLWYLSNSSYWVVKHADWTDLIRSGLFFNSEQMPCNWCILSPAKLNLQIQQVYQWLAETDKHFAKSVAMPQIKHWSKRKDLEDALDQIVHHNPQIVLIVVPKGYDSRCASIKRKFLVDNAILCHTVSEDSFTKSLNQEKIMLQIYTKLGSVPWRIKSQQGLMFMGLEVRVDRVNGQKFGAFVSSMDQWKSSGYYFSKTLPHQTDEELAESFGKATVEAVETYWGHHNTMPSGIIVYRGKTEEDKAFEEVKVLREMLNPIFTEHSAKLEMVFVIVDKDDPARFFVNKDSPPPGTVVDRSVTTLDRFDFFLIAEKVSKTEIATPIYYHVIENSKRECADEVQRITYDQCHMNFSCRRVCGVPAVSQYAENLAVLVSETLHETPNEGLNGKLYFM